MSHRYKEKGEDHITHREKVERAIVRNKAMSKVFNPIVDKIKKAYGAEQYEIMVDKLSLELSKKGVPFTLDNYDRQILTVEGLCQGIWREDHLKAFVAAGLEEKRYDLELRDELLRNPDYRVNEANHD